MDGNSLKEVIKKISMPDDMRRRMIQTDWTGRMRQRKRRSVRRAMAAACAVLILAAGSVFWHQDHDSAKRWGVRVYAKEDGGEGWTYLRRGERVQLEKPEDDLWNEVEMDLPEHYSYERETMEDSMCITILDDESNEVGTVTIIATIDENRNCYLELK